MAAELAEAMLAEYDRGHIYELVFAAYFLPELEQDAGEAYA